MGRVQTGMASFCKPPPTAEQREQQHLEEGQKFKQQVQKQRAACSKGSQAQPGRPRKDAFGMHSILSKARTKQQENKRPQAEEDEEHRGPGVTGGTQLSSFPSWRVDPCRCAGRKASSSTSWADSATSIGGEGEGGMG